MFTESAVSLKKKPPKLVEMNRINMGIEKAVIVFTDTADELRRAYCECLNTE